MSREKNLHDIRNYLFDKSESIWWRSFYLTAGMQALLLIAVLWNHPFVIGFSGFIALLAPLGVTWLRVWASSFSAKGDKCRRMVLYADGLGEDILPEDIAHIRGWTIGADLGPAPFTAPFYTSQLKAGPPRLADIIAESAYFTYCLTDKVLTRLGWVLILFICVLFAILYFGLSLANNANHTPLIAKIVLLIGSFILGGDLLLLRKRYSDLKQTAYSTFQKCAAMRRKRDLTLFEVMQVVEDYHLTLIQSPPIPLKIYLKYQTEVNETYQKSHAA